MLAKHEPDHLHDLMQANVDMTWRVSHGSIHIRREQPAVQEQLSDAIAGCNS